MSRQKGLVLCALCSLFTVAPTFAQEKASATRLIELAKSNSAELRGVISATFDAKDLSAGTAWAGQGPEFFFATNAAAQPSLMIDDAPGPQMRGFAGSDLWYAMAHIEPVGRLHSFYYMVTERDLGDGWICPHSRRCRIINPTCRRARSRTKSFTPARSTTA